MSSASRGAAFLIVGGIPQLRSDDAQDLSVRLVCKEPLRKQVARWNCPCYSEPAGSCVSHPGHATNPTRVPYLHALLCHAGEAESADEDSDDELTARELRALQQSPAFHQYLRVRDACRGGMVGYGLCTSFSHRPGSAGQRQQQQKCLTVPLTPDAGLSRAASALSCFSAWACNCAR